MLTNSTPTPQVLDPAPRANPCEFHPAPSKLSNSGQSGKELFQSSKVENSAAWVSEPTVCIFFLTFLTFFWGGEQDFNDLRVFFNVRENL